MTSLDQNGNGGVPWYRSIRFRLVVAAIAVELLMLGILLSNSYRLVNDALESQTRARLESLAPLLNASLAGYVFQRDHSEIKAILKDLVESRFTEIRYIVVLDKQNKLIASVGAHNPVNELEKSEDHSVREALSDFVYDAQVPLTLPGNQLGSARFGLSLSGMVSLRDTVLRQSLAIAALEVILSLLLLASGGYLITRHIATLLEATRRLARGNYGAHIEIGGRDEISFLANNFNRMAEAIQSRMDALQASKAALRESETRFRAIFDNVSDAIFVQTIDTGQVIDVNGRMLEMYGFSSREEALACDLMQISSAIHPYTEAEAKAHMRVAIEQGLQTFEWHARNKQGELFWVEVSLRPSRIGETPCLLAVVRDISERKAMEAELLAHRDHLEDLINERTAELAHARQEAEHLARVKSDFLANMSHEIRTPLNAVIGLARIGARDSKEQASHNNFELILDSSQHLLSVINDILDISKIEAGKLRIDVHPFSLKTMIDGAIRFVSTLAESKGLKLEVSLAPKVPEWVQGDSHRIAQILTNLLSNAVKFTEQGEVRIRVGADEEYLYFKVLDTGIGMSEAQKTHLFQPFEQADNSSTRQYGGTGLGLAISQNLAHLMGGDISVDSNTGAGSGFMLRLPLPAAEQPAEPDAPFPLPFASHQLAGLRVLAAEDVEVNRLILEDMLSQEGILVTFAENGLQAVKLAEQCHGGCFDAVLMDIQMPVMDGLEATKRIHAIAPDLPVIGLTAHALAEERQRCLDVGMVDHVTKPIDPIRLLAALAKRPKRNHAEAARLTPQPAVSSESDPDTDATLNARLSALPWLNLKQGLAITRGRIANYARLLRKYAEHHADGLDGLAERLASATPHEVQRFAHSLKGSSGSLGITGVQALAQALDMAMREGREEGGLIPQLAAELQRVVMAIHAATPLAAESSPPVVNRDALRHALLELEALLKMSNTGAERRFAQSAPLLHASLGKQAHELERLISDFQYPAALALVRALLKQA